MSAPQPAIDLVERFERDRKVVLSPDYKEEQLRLEFLNPFFESLGWDVSNKAGLTEVFKPVIHEESIKIAGATKAPADGSRRAAHSPRPSDSDSGRSAVSRWPLARIIGSLYYPDCPHELPIWGSID